MRKFNCFTIVFVLFLLITYPCYAELIPFDSGRWEFKERENKGDMTHAVKKYLGKKCLYLRIGEALVKDLDVTDGIIEYDVAFKEQGKGFLGILWHYLDGENTEHFYVRTHRSGELKATQYTPVINGSNSDVWYRSPAYAQPDVFTYNKWTPIKCILSGDYAELYIEDILTNKKKDNKEKKESILLHLNCEKALYYLNWHAVLSFEETVRTTSEWYQNYYNSTDNDMYDFTSKQIDEYKCLAQKRGLVWAK